MNVIVRFELGFLSFVKSLLLIVVLTTTFGARAEVIKIQRGAIVMHHWCDYCVVVDVQGDTALVRPVMMDAVLSLMTTRLSGVVALPPIIAMNPNALSVIRRLELYPKAELRRVVIDLSTKTPFIREATSADLKTEISLSVSDSIWKIFARIACELFIEVPSRL